MGYSFCYSLYCLTLKNQGLTFFFYRYQIVLFNSVVNRTHMFNGNLFPSSNKRSPSTNKRTSAPSSRNNSMDDEDIICIDLDDDSPPVSSSSSHQNSLAHDILESSRNCTQRIECMDTTIVFIVFTNTRYNKK